MNRQQLRRESRQKKKNDVVYNIKPQVLKDLVDVEIKKARKFIIKEATTNLISAFIVTLHDKFGFGTTRLNRVVKETNEQFKDIDEGKKKIKDFKIWCDEKKIDYKNIFGDDSNA